MGMERGLVNQYGIFVCFFHYHILLKRAIDFIEKIISLIKFDVLFIPSYFYYNKMKLTFRQMWKRSPAIWSTLPIYHPSLVHLFIGHLTQNTLVHCLVVGINIIYQWFCHHANMIEWIYTNPEGKGQSLSVASCYNKETW